MRLTLFRHLFLLLLSGTLVLSPNQNASSQESARSTQELTGNMVQVLTHFARTCKVPMLIEVAEPLEEDLRESFSSCDTRFLAAVANKHPNYAFAVRGRAVHFYERTLVADKQDFLNWRFQSFVLPNNVADFKSILTARLGSAGQRFGGGLVYGILPNDLLNRPLPNKQYANTSARDILLDVQDMDGSFYNVIIFPKQRDLNNSDIQKAFASWQWRSMISDPAKKE